MAYHPALTVHLRSPTHCWAPWALGCFCPLGISSRSTQACGVAHGLSTRETGVRGQGHSSSSPEQTGEKVKVAERGLGHCSNDREKVKVAVKGLGRCSGDWQGLGAVRVTALYFAAP